MTKSLSLLAAGAALLWTGAAMAQHVLPFPDPPMGGAAGDKPEG